MKLSELFHPGKDTLIIYSFMYGPNMAKACPMCTCVLDSLDGNAPHAAQRTNLVVVAKSRIERIREFGRGRGWRNLRLLSSAGNSYNRDYRGETAEGAQLPSLNVFVKRGDKIHHIYNTELMFAPRTKGQDARHVDAIWPLWNLLDFTPEGRGADWYPKLEYGAVEGGKQTLSRLAAHIAEDFLISRLVDAPRDKIWRCWTEPERLAAWFGPKGFETITAKLDFRPDGVYHYCMRGNGVDMWGKWTFREIDAPGKLVFINAFSDKDGGLGRHPLAPTWPAQMVTTALFSDFGPKTLITVQWSPYEANEVERKTFSDGMASMNQGWSGTFERLDAYLEENR